MSLLVLKRYYTPSKLQSDPMSTIIGVGRGKGVMPSVLILRLSEMSNSGVMQELGKGRSIGTMMPDVLESGSYVEDGATG